MEVESFSNCPVVDCNLFTYLYFLNKTNKNIKFCLWNNEVLQGDGW